MNWPARPEGHTPDKTGNPWEPWWTREAITWMDQYLKANMNVLEWGAGASTVWLAQRVRYLLSVEHDQQWADLIGGQLEPYKEGHFIDCLPLGFEYCEPPAEELDAAFVDGRLRVFCCIYAGQKLSSGGILLLDNAEDPTYAEVHELLKDWPVIRTDNGIWRTDIWTKP